MKLGGGREPKELRPRIIGLGVVLLLGLLVLAVNLYRLMVVRYDEFLALSIDNQFKDVRVRAPRGLIRDRRGEVLVDARPSLDVFITPAFCQKCVAEVLPRLQSILAWDDEQLRKVTQLVREAHGPQRYQPQLVQIDLTREQFDVLLAHQYLLPGVDLEPVPHRNYRAGATLAHVLGYMNEVTQEELTRLNGDSQAERPPYAMGDYIGRRGVERSFENVLRGQDGWVKQVVNARGEVMRDAAGNVLQGDEQLPKAGKNIILSIDARLQAEAERAFPGTAGAVVALESKTGFVLAMVSRPSFDPNEMTGRVSPQRLAQLNKDPLQPMIFRAGAEHYHPGSTFKVVTLLAALQSGAFTPQTVTTCGGGYSLGSRRWRCHKESGHGPVDARRALQVSCDTYFYRVADVLGIDPIAQVGRAFGLGSITNLGVVGEVPGVMPDSAYHDKVTPGGYQKGMALNTAIGQGDVNVTPLQLAVLYSAIGNGGAVYQPQVVSRIESPEGQVLETFGPKLVRQVPMTPEQHEVLVQGLVSVVNEAGGTATRSRLTEVTMAGKTGTAQVARLGAVRLKTQQMDYWERDHAWFAAFAPAEDPEITVVVLNEHGGHGGSDAAPTAAAVMRKYFELKKTDGQAFGPGYQPPAPLAPAPPPAVAPPIPVRATGATRLATGGPAPETIAVKPGVAAPDVAPALGAAAVPAPQPAGAPSPKPQLVSAPPSAGASPAGAEPAPAPPPEPPRETSASPAPAAQPTEAGGP
ncbi:MAG: penicillin-binding protein 2 [Myxococcota bacterium]